MVLREARGPALEGNDNRGIARTQERRSGMAADETQWGCLSLEAFEDCSSSNLWYPFCWGWMEVYSWGDASVSALVGS